MPMPGDEIIYGHTEYAAYARYPAYLSVTRRQKDGRYIVTVRSRDTCSAGQIVMTPEEWAAFKLEIA